MALTPVSWPAGCAARALRNPWILARASALPPWRCWAITLGTPGRARTKNKEQRTGARTKNKEQRTKADFICSLFFVLCSVSLSQHTVREPQHHLLVLNS